MTVENDRGAEGETIRAFFGVELEEAARQAAARVAHDLGERPGGEGVRWVPPRNYHVTLRFLGQIARKDTPSLIRHVAREARTHAPFELSLGEVTGLPTRRRPRVVVLELCPAKPLVSLARAVECGVVAAGFPTESRAFRAHLTLGRVKRGALSLVNPPVPKRCSFQVSEAVLFRSQLGPTGALYDPLERIALDAFDHPSTHSEENRRHGQ